jgi:putative Mn2+ efflux pump MntP
MPDFARLLGLGGVIGANNLAAALALGALGQAERRRRIVAVFGVFEFLIPLLGIWLGRQASGAVEEHAGWLGSVLLVALGLWSIAAAMRHRRDDERLAARVTTWRGLVLLAMGLSVDNLLIGFSLGLGGTEPLLVAGTISLFSMVFISVLRIQGDVLELGGRSGARGEHHRHQPAVQARGPRLREVAHGWLDGFTEPSGRAPARRRVSG